MTVYEGEIWCLCTVTFGQKNSKLNSRPVYCLQLLRYTNFLWLSEDWLKIVWWLSELTAWCKFFIMSTEFDKNISVWRYDCTDHKIGFDFFMRLVKWPKIAVKKCQNLIFKVNFQCQKSSASFIEEYQFCLRKKSR